MANSLTSSIGVGYFDLDKRLAQIDIEHKEMLQYIKATTACFEDLDAQCPAVKTEQISAVVMSKSLEAAAVRIRDHHRLPIFEEVMRREELILKTMDQSES